MRGNTDGFWLEDDPEWQELRHRTENTPIPKKQKTPSPQRASDTEEVIEKKVKLSFDITFPKIKIPKRLPVPARITQLPQRTIVIGAACIGVISLGIIGSVILVSISKKDPAKVAGAFTEGQEADFAIVLPEGKPEETSSGRVAYNAQRKVASFTDTVGGVDVTVSQQQLPDSFKSDPEGELQKLANNFNAKEVINESSPKVYLGTSEKGPQTAIFHKNGLLIFIYSGRKIDKHNWAEYITKLQ